MDKLDEFAEGNAHGQLASLKKQYERLGTEIEKLEQDAKTRSREAMLWPQVGDEYWYIDDFGDKYYAKWWGNDIGHYRLATGNCHRTEAEALAYREWQTDPRVVARKMIERMTKYIPNGSYRILWINAEKKLKAVYGLNKNGGLCYGYYDAAEEAFRKHPDLCKVALGVITDKEEAGRIVRLAIGNVSDSGEAMGK